MKTVMKKLLSLVLVAMLLVSAVPFQAAATEDQAAAPATYTVTVALQLDGEEKDSFDLEGCVAGSTINVKNHAESHTAWNVYMYNYGKYTVGEYDEEVTVNGDVTVYIPVTTNSTPPSGGNTGSEGTGSEGTGSEGTGSEGTGSEGTGSEGTGSENTGSGTTTTPAYGTLTIYVRTYNSNMEVKERTVTFQGEPSYKLSYELAVKALEKLGIVNTEEFKWQKDAGATLNMENGTNHTAYLIADPVNTPGNKKIVTLTLVNNDGTDARQTIECLAGDKILTVIANSKTYKEPTRKGWKFAGWSFDVNCSDDVNRDDVITEDMKIYAEWELIPETNKYDVTLRVYTNGDGVNVDRTFDMSGYGNTITRDEVKSVINKHYTAKKGYSLAYYGLFTNKTWDDGDYDMDDAVSSIAVNKDSKTVIYVMVKNVKVTEKDTSNPKTGDMIFAPVAVMTTAAAAAFILLANKKRLVK